MIKSYLELVIIFAVHHQVSSLSANVQHSVAHRKDKIKRLQDIQKRSEITQDPIDNYDLLVTKPSDTTLTKPVLRLRHRHRSGKGAKVTVNNDNPQIPKIENTLRRNTNLTSETNKTIQEDKDATTVNEDRSGEEKVAPTKIQEDIDDAMSQKPVKTNQNVTPVVPFYRRLNYLDDHERNKPQKWVHCLDLVGPFLKGYKDNWNPTQLTHRHTVIKRLSELLIIDVSNYSEEEIVSLLYQISNIEIRIFQWDYSAITTILNIIIRGTKHDFRSLKSGVKSLFERWHLDTSMRQPFLEQTRIFRPPCIDISGNAGYTKKAGGVVLYTKPDKPPKKPKGDESCHSREITSIK